jgi:hypothetical protein
MHRALAVLLCAAAFGYTPATDTAGPITVSLQPPALGTYGAGGYADLTRSGVPLTIPVTVQNTSGAPISGTLRVAVIDHWTVDPAAPVAFQLGPHGRLRREFTVTFGAGTYNANYPIHAYAEFAYQGVKRAAHPVLIVRPRIADLLRPKLPVEWKPVAVPAGGALGLWRLPVRRESAEIVNMGADAGAAGREVYDAGSIVLYGPRTRSGQTREGIGMTLGKRPPSLRETVEAAGVEYPLALPAVKPLHFDFAVAGNASFTVKVAPFAGGAAETLYEHKPQGAGWEAATVALDRFAGTSVRLRLEARGAGGEAQWATPTIAAGEAPRPPAFPPTGAAPKVLGRAGGCEVGLWPISAYLTVLRR